MALIATVRDVQDHAGVSVGSETIRRAQTIIDLVCGRDLNDAEVIAGLGARDQSRLKVAVAYQAAWMDSHPEIYSTMDVDEIDQDDLNVKFRDDPEAQLLAPLAKLALRRVTWRKRGMASVSVNSVFQRRSFVENWKPIR